MPLHTPPQSNNFCWHPGGLKLTNHALSLCAIPTGSRVLDVGSGAGHSTKLLQELGFESYALDMQKPNTMYADSLFLPNLIATAENLPFQNQCFGAIICECVFSLMQQKQMVLQEFWRICYGKTQKSYLIINDMYNKNGHANDALSLDEMQNLLQNTGWNLECFEDHSESLRDFAAQLLWHNLKPCSINLQAYGYGLWIATKENV